MDEVSQLQKDIRQRINKLRHLGVSEDVIENILASGRTLGRLLITADYRLLLPDNGNAEIILTPLQRTIYLLFLKYPDGIRFKDLFSYKEELYSIYLSICNRENLCGMTDSICGIINPMNNRINENCSRIKRAVLNVLDTPIAEYYFITGAKSKPKKILLDRSLVKYE